MWRAHFCIAAALVASTFFTPRSVSCEGVDLETPSALLDKAIALVEQGIEENDDPELLEAAETLARRAAELQPDNATLWKGLGEILLASRDYRPAEEVFATAVELGPDDAEAHHMFGLSRGLQHNYFAAEDPLRQAVALAPDNAEYQLALGSALGNLDKSHQAERSLARAIRLGAVSEAEDQLRKLWGKDGRVQVDTQTWQRALQFEFDIANATSTAFGEQVSVLRDYEKASTWRQTRLRVCSQSSETFPCDLHTVFLEGWQLVWHHVQPKPSSRHAVINGGIGPVCLFARTLGSATTCCVVEEFCEPLVIATTSVNDSSSIFLDAVECQPASRSLSGVDAVWVMDVGAPREAHVAIERKMEGALSLGSILILFRAPQLARSGFELLSNATFEPKCVGTINDKCHAWRPLVSWQYGQNLSLFVLRRVTSDRTEL